jgi:hypothetical protein
MTAPTKIRQLLVHQIRIERIQHIFIMVLSINFLNHYIFQNGMGNHASANLSSIARELHSSCYISTVGELITLLPLNCITLAVIKS